MARRDGFPEPLALRRDRAEPIPRRAAAQAECRLLSSLAARAAEWRELAARALEPNVFYEPAFALAAASVFGVHAAAVLVRRAGRLIGLFPVHIERRYGVMATVTGWTHPYAPLGVPLVDRDDAETAIAAWLDLVEADGPRLVLLPMLPRDGAFAAALRRVLSRRGGMSAEFGTHARALLWPAEDRAGYLEQNVPHKKLKELRRQRRRLADAGTVGLVTAREAADIAAALADFLALEASGWKGSAGSAAGTHAPIRAFMQRALTELAERDSARIDRLMQDGRPLAAAITLRSGDTAWFWKIAYDEAHARFSPGVQISLDLTGALLADPALVRVDSCATADHPMIDHLWRERLALCDLLIAPAPDMFSTFQIARRLEALRRAAIGAARNLRDTVRGR
jgi:CelD/BcsL family acetyltransferase involved in cellulose biosynthesis